MYFMGMPSRGTTSSSTLPRTPTYRSRVSAVARAEPIANAGFTWPAVPPPANKMRLIPCIPLMPKYVSELAAHYTLHHDKVEAQEFANRHLRLSWNFERLRLMLHTAVFGEFGETRSLAPKCVTYFVTGPYHLRKWNGYRFRQIGCCLCERFCDLI